MEPLERVRRSMSNWSDAEVAAFASTMHRASEECTSRSAADYAGEDLIALARLCSLGQRWDSVVVAASKYLSEQTNPHLARAFALLVDAYLRQNDSGSALAASKNMLEQVPYDPIVAASVDETFDYLEIGNTDDAVKLLGERQPYLLAAFKATKSLSNPAGSGFKMGDLYADGLKLAIVQKYVGEFGSASSTVADLDEALAETSTQVCGDDSLAIAEARKQYKLLGSELPPIAPSRSLLGRSASPTINHNYGAATILLLFPESCIECLQMSMNLTKAAVRMNQDDVHLYALLIQDPNSLGPSYMSKSKATEVLKGTPTLIVSPEMTSELAGTDYPLAIVTDSLGIIRFMQVAPSDALEPNGFLEQVVSHIMKQWPITRKVLP